MKNPNRLLKKLRTFANKNIRDVINNQEETIIPPVPKKYLPKDCYLRDLYNQAYFCHYANLGDSALSLLSVCLERISRDLYIKFKGDDTDIHWNQILEQLSKYFREEYQGDDNFKGAMLEFLSNCLIIKDDIRNYLLHGKIDLFIRDTKFTHKITHASTGEVKTIDIPYDEAIHGKDKQKIKNVKIGIVSHKTLVFISMAIIRFNKHLNLSEL